MSWVVMNNAKVLKDSETDALGIRCGCSEEVIKVGNAWKDVTMDFTWDERVVPEYCAMLAGNNVLHVNAMMSLSEEIIGSTHLFETTKWTSLIESVVPILVLHRLGTVSVLTGYYNAYGYVEADLTDVALTDRLYIDIVVPVE